MRPFLQAARRRPNAAAFRCADAIPALVLAAGASRRLGRPKALLRFRGEPLLDHAIRQARLISADVRVMTGCRAPLLRYYSRRPPTSWQRVDNWAEGMSASLTAGIGTLPTSAAGVFVILVDQPVLDHEQLKKFGARARAHPWQPLAAEYNGHPGVPAYLPRWLWPEVSALRGGRGAGGLLKAANACRMTIDGVLQDVDTREDWRALSRLQ
ncbi:molybdenum cofactor cytidylyltransferase/nicotine blue oxidoreductase [Marinobacter daqiaonensis]|uniref:Molybdenum cofactor cytidylyltransferase/nicotine blue oxidoreductase n=1 Tax=Marinobacter daqiaonensis TaxID=650891 RepID=A0A1I6JFS0_9GAMM|nr:nucleotidyltransferase family protein [Marinobacter daqiaonensis]SFR77837.1 molybdenum cofactor cytidylyltransferase/nicotine blue oxidoreductase [Marinobacter daqiaonensis]